MKGDKCSSRTQITIYIVCLSVCFSYFVGCRYSTDWHLGFWPSLSIVSPGTSVGCVRTTSSLDL